MLGLGLRGRHHGVRAVARCRKQRVGLGLRVLLDASDDVSYRHE